MATVMVMVMVTATVRAMVMATAIIRMTKIRRRGVRLSGSLRILRWVFFNHKEHKGAPSALIHKEHKGVLHRSNLCALCAILSALCGKKNVFQGDIRSPWTRVPDVFTYLPYSRIHRLTINQGFNKSSLLYTSSSPSSARTISAPE